MSTNRPLAREKGLTIQPMDNETLVYDSVTQNAYVLNPITSAVWYACDGKHTVQELTQQLNQKTPTSESVVWYALKQLEDLLEEPAALPHEYVGMTRRQFLARTGLVAAALTIPVVTKIALPSAAHAQSATNVRCICVNGDSCAPNNCADCPAECSDLGGFIGCDNNPCN